jgi:hypothetical protein
VNEDALLACLRDLDSPLGPAGLHHLCSLSLLACRDRVTTREFFVDVLQLCEALADSANRIDRAVTVSSCIDTLDQHQRLDTKKLNPQEKSRLPDMLRARFTETHAVLTRQRLALAELVEQLLACPSLNDRVS